MELQKKAKLSAKPMSFVSAFRTATGLNTNMSMKDRAITKHLVVKNLAGLKEISEEDSEPSQVEESSLEESYVEGDSFEDEEGRQQNIEEMMSPEQKEKYNQFHEKINMITGKFTAKFSNLCLHYMKSTFLL